MALVSPTTTRTRLPIPLLVLLAAAVVVLLALLYQVATGVFVWIIQISLILSAFVAIGFVGYYLWRKGDLRSR